MLKHIQVQKHDNILLFFETFSYNSSLKPMFIIVLAGPSAQIMHSFHEDINGSKFSWHGNNNAMFCIFSILSFLTCVMCVVL